MPLGTSIFVNIWKCAVCLCVLRHVGPQIKLQMLRLNTQRTIRQTCTERYKKNISDIKCMRDKVYETQTATKKNGCLQTRWWWKQSDNEVIYLLTYLLTTCSRVLLEKVTASQLIKKFPTSYGTRKFITAFTSARHHFLSWASSIQSMPPYTTSRKSILRLSSHLCLGLPSCLFPSGFPAKTQYTPLLSPIRAAYLPISFFLI